MREYYDRRAPWHDDYMDASSLDGLRARFAEVLSVVTPLVRDATVLEIACGTGNWTQLLAEHARTVTAIDSSPRALDLAAVKLRLAENVTLCCLDAFEIDQIGGRFDCLFASDWYSHIPRSLIPVFLTKLKTVARSGAKLILLDMNCFRELAEEISGYDEEGNCLSRRELPDGSVYEIIKNFPTEEDLRSQLRGWGSNTRFILPGQLNRWLTITNRSIVR